jgi:hypothetical protein
MKVWCPTSVAKIVSKAAIFPVIYLMLQKDNKKNQDNAYSHQETINLNSKINELVDKEDKFI